MSDNFDQPPEQQTQPVVATANPVITHRTSSATSIIGGLVLLLALAVGAFFLFNRAGNPGPPDSDTHALLLPKDSLTLISYNSRADANTTPNLDRIKAAFESQPNWKQASEQVKKDETQSATDAAAKCKNAPALQLINDTNNLWREDVTYAFVPPSAEKLKSLNPQSDCFGYDLAKYGVIFIVNTTIEPEDKSTLTGQVFVKTKGKVTLDKAEDYNGDIIYKLPLGGSDFLVTMRGTNAIVTMDSELMHRALDAGKDATLSLASDAEYQSVVSKLPANRMFTIYVNINKVGQFSKQLSGNTDTSNTGAYLPFFGLDSVKGLAGLSMVAQDTGIQVDTASTIDSSYLDLKYKAQTLDSRTMPGKAPANVLGLLASQDLKGLVNAAQSFSLTSLVLGSGGGNASFAEAKKQFKAETGLDVDADVLSWMGGEWLVYVAAEGKDASGSPNFGGSFAIKLGSADDKAKAQNFVTKITEYARKQAAASPTPSSGQSADPNTSKRTIVVANEDVNGVKFTTVDITQGSGSYSSTSTIYYAIVDDAFVVASSKTAAANYGKGDAVTSFPIYQTSVKYLDAKNGGLIYLNLSAIRLIAEQALLKDDVARKQYEQETQPWIAPLKGVVLTNTQADYKFIKVRLNFFIDKP